MEVTNYIFRSPYPNQIQMGMPEYTTKQSSNNQENISISKEENTQNINSNELKAQTNDKKLTDNTSFLDIYA